MDLLEKIKLWLRARKYRKTEDPGGIAWLHEVIKPGHTVLDIGCHKGGYLYHMVRKVGPKGQVIAFEPQSALYRYILKMKEIFGWSQVQVEHIALSDAPGEASLFVPYNKVSKGSSPGASLRSHLADGQSGFTEIVHTETLDAYCCRHQLQPHVLKIDVEGNEQRIFEGGRLILQQYKPKIMVEIEARHVGQLQAMDTLALLQSWGYVGHAICGRRRIPISKFDFTQHQRPGAGRRFYCNNFVFE